MITVSLVESTILKVIRDAKYHPHGLEENDIATLNTLIKTAEDNDRNNKTVFPDFIASNGFLEHFKVTSGISHRKKGFENKRLEKNTERKNIARLEQRAAKEFQVSSEQMILKETSTFMRTNDSLDQLHNSIKRCWENHIEHLKKFSGRRHYSCFIIESDDIINTHIAINDNKQNNIDRIIMPNDLSWGDINGAHLYRRLPYCIAYDLEMLNYLYSFQKEIDYCLFLTCGNSYIEALKLKNIPRIQQYLHSGEYEIHNMASVAIQSCTTYRPLNLDKELRAMNAIKEHER